MKDTNIDQIAGTPAGTVMTPEYAATVARFAYLWGWPLVNNLNRALGVKDLPGPGRVGGVIPASPLVHVSMLTDYISADEHYATCPNQDTVYGAGYQHTDTIPVAIQVPDFGNRFYTYQIADARTNSFGKIGKQYGAKPGFYALVDLIGRARSLRASPKFFIHPLTWWPPFPESFKTTHPKTRPRFSLSSTRS
jgi:hypothetical protein